MGSECKVYGGIFTHQPVNIEGRELGLSFTFGWTKLDTKLGVAELHEHMQFIIFVEKCVPGCKTKTLSPIFQHLSIVI